MYVTNIVPVLLVCLTSTADQCSDQADAQGGFLRMYKVINYKEVSLFRLPWKLRKKKKWGSLVYPRNKWCISRTAIYSTAGYDFPGFTGARCALDLTGFNKSKVFCSCPPGWSQYTPDPKNVKPKCYFVSRDHLAYTDAMQTCRLLGEQYHRNDGQLVEITLPILNNYVSYIVNITGVPQYGFYIGCNDIAVEGQWVWPKSGQPLRYHNWAPNEPNNRNGVENCAVLRYMPDNGFFYTWTDDQCSDQYNYVCEIGST